MTAAGEPDPERLAAEALLAFERFQDTGAAADLDECIAAGERAVRCAPDHPEAENWRYLLMVAYRARGWAERNAADWDAALRHGTDLRRAVDDDPDAAVDVDAELALTLYGRFDSPAKELSDDEVRTRNRELVERLSDLLPSAGQAMLLGMARLDRFCIAGDPADRTSGLELLAAALPELSDDEPLVPHALVMFATALDEARRADGVDPVAAGRMRDQAIDAVERARGLFTAEERPQLVLLDGELRCSRGDTTDDVADLRAGLRRLELFEQVADREDAERGVALLQQAMARVRLWQLTDDPAERWPVVDCCDRALAAGLPDDLVVDAHRRALDVVCARLTDDASAHELASAQDRFDAAVLVLNKYPGADVAFRAELAMTLAGLSAQLVGTGLDPDRLAALLDIARTHPDPHEEWGTLLDLLTALHRFMAGVLSGNPDFDVLAEVIAVWRRTGHADLLGDQLAAIAGALACFDGSQTGDLSRLRAARGLLEQRSAVDGSSGIILALVVGIETHRRARSDAERIDAVRQLVAAAEAAPPDEWSRNHLLPFVRAMAGALGGTAPPPVPSPRTGADPLGRLLDDLTSAMTIFSSLPAATDDPVELRRRLDAGEQKLARFAPGSPARVAAVLSLAVWWLHAARSVPGDPVAAEAAVRWNAAAVDELGGPQHPLWAQHATNLAVAHRLRGHPGDLAASRGAGLEALRGHAWQVLVQAGTEHGLTAASTAAELAGEVAQWCAADGADDDLMCAVEAGRGLVLYAATTTRGVARALADLGEHDLAAEWVQAGGDDRRPLPADSGFDVDVRGDLRRRVLRVLHTSNSAVLDPPAPERVAAALRRVGCDALVYLGAAPPRRRPRAPARGAGPAAGAPATGRVEVLDLPGLRTGAEPLARYAAAYRQAHPPALARTRELTPPLPSTSWPDELDRLVHWAWDAAAGPLLAAARGWSAGPTPRLVLVPTGHLALVPWHAAVRDDDGPRYLVHDAVVSYAASARLLCELVDRPPVTGGTSVLIGNPTDDLRSAGIEAEAVRTAFYPDATYLGPVIGRTGSHGRGTRSEVLNLLGDRSRPCAMLHLACHARAEAAAPERSHLLLAGSEPLEIGKLLDRSPGVALPLDAVLLAACSTTVSGLDYDEAFSLATAFLAAGARSVVGSLWPVPDDSTAHLMFMVHHFRQVEGLPMADALRRAQLWMLEPEPRLPATFPAGLADAAPPAAHVCRGPVSWAAFTHQGW